MADTLSSPAAALTSTGPPDITTTTQGPFAAAHACVISAPWLPGNAMESRSVPSDSTSWSRPTTTTVASAAAAAAAAAAKPDVSAHATSQPCAYATLLTKGATPARIEYSKGSFHAALKQGSPK
jgi:hypothetical protein